MTVVVCQWPSGAMPCQPQLNFYGYEPGSILASVRGTLPQCLTDLAGTPAGRRTLFLNNLQHGDYLKHPRNSPASLKAETILALKEVAAGFDGAHCWPEMAFADIETELMLTPGGIRQRLRPLFFRARWLDIMASEDVKQNADDGWVASLPTAFIASKCSIVNLSVTTAQTVRLTPGMPEAFAYYPIDNGSSCVSCSVDPADLSQWRTCASVENIRRCKLKGKVTALLPQPLSWPLAAAGWREHFRHIRAAEPDWIILFNSGNNSDATAAQKAAAPLEDREAARILRVGPHGEVLSAQPGGAA